MIADDHGDFASPVQGLDRPTSMEIVGTTAYIVGLSGGVVRVGGIATPPFGRSH